MAAARGGLTRFEAFCVCVNLLMGVGFLSLPSAFVDAGLALSVLLLAVGSALLILTALWEAETILRATAVKQWRASAAAARERGGGGGEEAPALAAGEPPKDAATAAAAAPALAVPLLLNGGGEDRPHGTQITVLVEEDRRAGVAAKFADATRDGLFAELSALRTCELTEVCAEMSGARAKGLYCACIALYQTGSLWSFASVFGEAIASIAPLPGVHGGASCDIYSEGGDAGCVALYRCWVALFGAAALPLALLGVREQKAFQVAMTALRALVAVLMVLVVAGAALSRADRAEVFGDEADARGAVEPFRGGGVFTVFSIIVFAELMNANLGVLADAVADKRDLGPAVAGGMGATAVAYAAIALVVGGYFGRNTDGSSNVSFSGFALGGCGACGRAIRVAIVGFPALDVLSIFPMNVIVLANNLMAVYYDEPAAVDAAMADGRARAAWRFAAALPPLALAFGWWSLDRILAFTGVIGMLIAFVVPACLYARARARCAEVFGADAAVSRPLFVPERLATARATGAIVGFGCVMAVFTLFDTVVIDTSADGKDGYI